MILTLLTIAGSIGAFEGGRAVFKKLKTRYFPPTNNEKNEWYQRPYLEGVAWDEFERHIAEDCRGWKFTEASCQALMDSGYRFTCAQIYCLAEKYRDRFSKNDARIKDFLNYELTAAGEAEEKISGLILGTDKHLRKALLPAKASTNN